MHSELLLKMRPSAHAIAVDAVVTTMYRLTAAVVVVCTTVFAPKHLYARDDGRFANSPLKEWFDHLASRNGVCCAFADGVSLQDVDWDTQDGHYRVRIQGEWIVVPARSHHLFGGDLGQCPLLAQSGQSGLNGAQVAPAGWRICRDPPCLIPR